VNDGLQFQDYPVGCRSYSITMKAIPLLSLFVLLSPLVAQNAPTPAEKKPEQAKRELLPVEQAFLNLPEETRKDYNKHIGDANRLFQQKRIFETFDELEKAAKIFPDSPEFFSLRGSCYVEIRAFDKALADYTKGIELAKDDPNFKFNIGEVYFVTKQWQKASEILEDVVKQLAKSRTDLSRLAEFKIMLCKKKLGKDAEVKALAEKYDFLDDSPYYYYAQAALAYDEKDLTKAEEWLARANRIFNDNNLIAPWQDTMVEYGYIKSFYGSDAEDDK